MAHWRKLIPSIVKALILAPAEFAEVSREDHLRYFTSFAATLLDDFSRYIKNTGTVDLLNDGVGYQKFPIELSDEEFSAVTDGIKAAIVPYINNQPAPGRRRRIFATIVMPDLESSLPSGEPAPESSGVQIKPDKEKE